jgi:hypothetical protein
MQWDDRFAGIMASILPLRCIRAEVCNLQYGCYEETSNDHDCKLGLSFAGYG